MTTYESGYGFPPRLCPELNTDSRNPCVGFDEWWPSVRNHFPNLPKVVAKEWLHRHWAYSSYSWLNLKNYDFILEKVESEKIQFIRTINSDFKEDNSNQISWGENYCGLEGANGKQLYLAEYMSFYGCFPTPIIVLDNIDNHLNMAKYPKQLILIEGHTRFSVAMYLNDIGKLNKELEIYIMKIIDLNS